VRLNPQAFTTDVAGFEAAVRSAYRAETPAAQAAFLEEALTLYAGELIPGYYEDWIVSERERLAEAYRSALSRLALAKAKTGDLSGAIETARKAVEADPLREASHYDLMRLYVAARRPAEALRQYKELEATLQKELGTAPARALQSLAEQLRQGGATSRPLESVQTERSPVAVGPLTERESCPQTPLTNLQPPLSSFIGRESEIEQIEQLLSQTRLLTLTGTGGAGKTRLALQVGAHLQSGYPHGVWMVELASLTNPDLVAQAVATVLGVAEAPGRPLEHSLCATLADKTLLLLLDNCEHLIEACAHVAETLLKACPRLCILATSREGLGIAGEMCFRVPSLSLPDPDRLAPLPSLLQYEAVRLFVERARFHQPTFALTEANAPALTSACQRLDGLPLAIELAAARVKAMPVEQIASRLEDRFTLLTGGSRTALPRQQTLRALLDWSYQLLSEKEKSVLGRLGVFAGGFSLEAAEAVCALSSHPPASTLPSTRGEGEIQEWEILDLLTGLVDKSLVIYEQPEGIARYRLLETIRHYALERLRESGEEQAIREQHLEWCLQLAETAQANLAGTEQAAALAQLNLEHDNLRAALDGCLHGGDVPSGLLLARALADFWVRRGHLSEGRARFSALLDRAAAQELTEARTQALKAAGLLAFYQGDYAAARALFEERLDRYRQWGHEADVASTLNDLGLAISHQGDYVAAFACYEESLAIQRTLGDRQALASTMNNFGTLARRYGDYRLARSLLEEALALRRESGMPARIAVVLSNLSKAVQDQGDNAAARLLLEESLALRRQAGDRWRIAIVLDDLGALARSEKDYDRARALASESLEIYRQMGARRGIAIALASLALVEEAQGRYAEALALLEESLALRRGLEDSNAVAELLLQFGPLAGKSGDPAAAFAYLEECLRIRRERGEKREMVATLEALGGLASTQRKDERAGRLLGAAQALRESLGIPLPPEEQEAADRQRADLQAAMGAARFSAALAQGAALTLEQALACALESAGDL